MWQSAEDTLVAGDRLAEVLIELMGLLPGREQRGQAATKEKGNHE
jgi:hypothetical protein